MGGSVKDWLHRDARRAGVSRCNKCGAEYPSAPAGVFHKCGRCSGGACSPIGVEDVGMMRALGEDRTGDWMETVSGVRFYPLDARVEEVVLGDVAHHLSRINRYNGACRLEHYSVAEHATAMAWWMYGEHGDARLALQALHHDDPEAYIGDMVRPLKRNMPGFTAAEDALWPTIARAMGVAIVMDDRVKEADNRILVDERAQVMNPSPNTWGIDHLVPLGVTLVGHPPNVARNNFLTCDGVLRHHIAKGR